MKQTIIIVLAIIILFQISGNYKEDYYVIPNESIRIRIIPNSNNIKDQILKNKVKNNLETEIEKDLKESKNITETRRIINENINKYNTIVKKVLKKENSNEKYAIDYGNHYFPQKKYKGILYKAGEYESLLVTIGQGEGDNWWCVLFPPICAFETDNSNKEDIEYRLYIKEMFDKYIK